MATGGRVPSYGIYQEQYVDNSWAVEEGGSKNEACIPENYGDTAVVPVVAAEGDELYTDTGYPDNVMKLNCDGSSPSAPFTHPSPSQPSGLIPEDLRLGDYAQNNVLYVLEDRVRHLVNVNIEEFRSSVQHIFYQEFAEYRQSLVVQEEAARKNQPMCKDVKQPHESACTNQSSDSGVCEGVTCDEETAINECVIKLLTRAASITRTLQRKEYAII